jgi:hypothetical protein
LSAGPFPIVAPLGGWTVCWKKKKIIIFLFSFSFFFLLISEFPSHSPKVLNFSWGLETKKKAQVKAWPYFPQKKNLIEALNQGMYSYANLSFPHDISWTVDTAGIFEPQDTT